MVMEKLRRRAVSIEDERRGLGTETEWIPENEHPETGERFRFTIPTGHVMALYADRTCVGKDCGTDGPDINPVPWPDGVHELF